jgi:hypothetical protein
LAEKEAFYKKGYEATVWQAEKDRTINWQDMPKDRTITATVGLKASELNLDAEKDLQVDVKTLPAVVQAEKDRVITDVVAKLPHKYLAPTSLAEGGTATVWAPAAGKSLRVTRIQFTSDARTRIDLRWGTEPFESYFVPQDGSIVVNLIGTNQYGGVNQALTILSSKAATVSASADGEEI